MRSMAIRADPHWSTINPGIHRRNISGKAASTMGSSSMMRSRPVDMIAVLYARFYMSSIGSIRLLVCRESRLPVLKSLRA